jgi:hypothetical protein
LNDTPLEFFASDTTNRVCDRPNKTGPAATAPKIVAWHDIGQEKLLGSRKEGTFCLQIRRVTGRADGGYRALHQDLGGWPARWQGERAQAVREALDQNMHTAKGGTQKVGDLQNSNVGYSLDWPSAVNQLPYMFPVFGKHSFTL